MVEVTWSGSGRHMSGGERGDVTVGRGQACGDVSGGQVSEGARAVWEAVRWLAQRGGGW
jgi:hypothetical protein